MQKNIKSLVSVLYFSVAVISLLVLPALVRIDSAQAGYTGGKNYSTQKNYSNYSKKSNSYARPVQHQKQYTYAKSNKTYHIQPKHTTYTKSYPKKTTYTVKYQPVKNYNTVKYVYKPVQKVKYVYKPVQKVVYHPVKQVHYQPVYTYVNNDHDYNNSCKNWNDDYSHSQYSQYQNNQNRYNCPIKYVKNDDHKSHNDNDNHYQQYKHQNNYHWVNNRWEWCDSNQQH
jgi:hypothetical protein